MERKTARAENYNWNDEESSLMQSDLVTVLRFRQLDVEAIV